MTKGKLLTTPSRLLKLILPLNKANQGSSQEDTEPLALLVHPQQPLSYLERLIQSELPTLRNAQGEEKPPAVHFRAEDPDHDSLMPGATEPSEKEHDESEDSELEATRVDGEAVKTGKLKRNEALELRGGPGEGGVETYGRIDSDNKHTVSSSPSSSSSTPSRTFSDPKTFVRWSLSTEIGDFIRDAARGSQFAIEIEGAPEQILVGVPTFHDRTHYLRKRLRKLSQEIASLASVKSECDKAAFQGARRVAMGGFGLLVGWWYMYLVGLTTVMCGYLWFLFNNREVSYRAALNLTVNRRQNKLYQQRGLDLERWETLLEEAKLIRKEIRAVADEYNVEWDERKDEKAKEVVEILEREGQIDDDEKKSRLKNKRKQKKKED
ncbi:MAG: hypothetical protein M1823_003547 [Watsoniomyces obsoletus]|nr:MAG: hypothetical protein M1823_003547 [Watsoniomyces obsoletus]